MTDWILAKFGGTSMGSIDTMTQCAAVVKQRKANIVVVSATSGTTNQLVELAELARQGEHHKANVLLEQIEERHVQMLLTTAPSSGAVNKLQGFIKELKTLVKGCTLLKECSPKAYDALVSTGELLSSTIFTSLLQKQTDKKVYWFDSRRVLATDSQHGKARPDIAKIKCHCEQTFLEPDALYIGQGFIGSDEHGITTTLGRGGSDYSAALIAEGISAKELQIWTDVPGMASTDPRICPDAKSIDAISIKEASEMATFGAKILHPSSLMPAIRQQIPVFVGSTFEPDEAGTTITPDVELRPVVRAVTSRSRQLLVVINNPDMLTASGFLQRIFAVFDQFEISVDAITTSEISIAVTIDHSEYPEGARGEQFLAALREHGAVKLEKNMALIAIVGNDLHQTPGIGARIFNALDNINVRMITQGASSHNFCLIVSEEDAARAVKQLHDQLID
jgi:aspartate kinase